MTANDSMIVAVNWISRIFVHLDDFFQSKTIKGESLSPGYFMIPDFPLESTYKLRPWFIELWNTKIVQKLRNISNTLSHDDKKTLNNDKLHSTTSSKDEFEDPIKFIIKTWPWKEDAVTFGLPQALIPVFHGGNTRDYQQNMKLNKNPTDIGANIKGQTTAGKERHEDAFSFDDTNIGRVPSSTLHSLKTEAEDDPLVIKYFLLFLCYVGSNYPTPTEISK